MSRTSWLRVNRWWLLVLPVSLIAMLGASAYRVQDFYTDRGWRDAVATSAPGEFVESRLHFSDALGETSSKFSARFTGLSTVDEIEPRTGTAGPPPDGVTAYAVHLDFKAAPGADLGFCWVMLVDEDGNRYGGEIFDPVGQANKCVPNDTPGPRRPFSKEEKRGEIEPGLERPETWDVEPVVLVKKGVRITSALVGFQEPEYVVLTAPKKLGEAG